MYAGLFLFLGIIIVNIIYFIAISMQSKQDSEQEEEQQTNKKKVGKWVCMKKQLIN